MSVVKLAQNIRDLRTITLKIKDDSQDRIIQIRQESVFTQQDNKEFNDLLNQIKRETLEKLSRFYQEKITQKTVNFQKELTECDQEIEQINGEVDDSKNQVHLLIQRNEEKVHVLEIRNLKLLIQQEKLQKQKLIFNVLKSYSKRKIHRRKQNIDAQGFYEKKLYNKVFYPWRSMSHLTGYQNLLINQAQKELKNVQQQFLDIIKVLKAKIAETEDQIQIKKNAKAEFSYSLSRNLLKTISNLSMEVMSLNQVTIRDNQIQNDDNSKFLKDLNSVIQTKLQNVNNIREKLKSVDEVQHKKQKQSIQFDLQNKK
ncbi:hypothetical protein pb186bvf_000591 [Paramecium bursaria]